MKAEKMWFWRFFFWIFEVFFLAHLAIHFFILSKDATTSVDVATRLLVAGALMFYVHVVRHSKATPVCNCKKSVGRTNPEEQGGTGLLTRTFSFIKNYLGFN